MYNICKSNHKMNGLLLKNIIKANGTNGKRALSSNVFIPSQHAVYKSQMIAAYEKNKEMCETFQPKQLINPKGVFSNNEIDLKNVQIYGFDYDYTLAYYNVSLYKLIFNLARDTLIENYKYPKELQTLQYSPKFPIRGLHLEKRKGIQIMVTRFDRNLCLPRFFDIIKHVP